MTRDGKCMKVWKERDIMEWNESEFTRCVGALKWILHGTEHYVRSTRNTLYLEIRLENISYRKFRNLCSNCLKK